MYTATRNNTDDRSTEQKWEEKYLNEGFKRRTSDILHEKTWSWLRKGNLKRETESIQKTQSKNT